MTQTNLQKLLITVILTILLYSEGLINKTTEWPQGGLAPEGVVTSIYGEISISSLPKVGEPFEVLYVIECLGSWEKIRFGPDYTVRFTAKNATILDGEITKFKDYLKKNETREFLATMIIDSVQENISIHVCISDTHWTRPQGGVSLAMYVVDEETGQYGSKGQFNVQKYSVLARYNNLEPQWLNEYNPTWVEGNRQIVLEVMQFEPSLNDSEALCLHQDNYLLIINGIGDSSDSDTDRIVHLLRAGWLKAQRADKEEKINWFNEFMNKHRGKWSD